MSACSCSGTVPPGSMCCSGPARALLVACACAVLAAHARAHPACSYASSGFLTGVPYYLAMTYLTPGLPDWRISVPVPAECAQGRVSGEEALACDVDAQPHVRVVERAVLVRRAGSLQGYATVNITVFCVFPYVPYSTYSHTPPPSNAPNIPSQLPKVPSVRPNVSPVVKKRLKHSRTTTPTMKPRTFKHRVNESTSSAELPSASAGSSSSSYEEKPSVNRRAEWLKPAHLWSQPQELLGKFMKYSGWLSPRC